MAAYIILSKLSHDAFRDPKEFPAIAKAVADRIKRDCPGVQWKQSFATMGRYDVVDVVEAEDPGQVERAALIIRALGHATTETLAATPWQDFLGRLR